MSRSFEHRRRLIAALVAFATILASSAGAAAAAATNVPAGNASGAGKFGLGAPATPQQIAGWDIDVRPDGHGLPSGRGSVAQGQEIYDAKCASCHGTFGESTDYIAIAGGVGSLASSQPVRTTGSKLNYATTLFDYIRRAMPFQNPKTLGNDEVYALTAYVLNLNDILPADAVLDRESILKVKMPNREGFTTAHGFMRRDGKPDVKNVACMSNCVAEVKLSSEMPDYARDSHGNLAEQSRTIGPVEGARLAGAVPEAARAAAAPQPAQLAQQQGCLACHAVDRKVVGPGFREIASRYAGDGGAEKKLAVKLRAGGSGTWGAVPMPPQGQLQDGEVQSLVQWILAGAK